MTNGTETNLNTGRVLTHRYTYTNNLISSVQTYTSGCELESEITIHDDNSQRVTSYDQVRFSDENLSTYWQAIFLCDNDQIVHCDGQTWSSVEYNDVYDSVYIYTTNERGDFVQMNRLEDCSFSASSPASSNEISVDYDDKRSPFSNVLGNHVVINSLIGIFTNTKTLGYHNNISKRNAYIDGVEEVQTWMVDYNESMHPHSMYREIEEVRLEKIEITYYQEMVQ